MELNIAMNYLRFFALFFSSFYSASPLSYVLFSFISTAFYSLLVAFIPQSPSSIILHRCINRIPSTLLLLFTSYFDSYYRMLLIFIAAVQYLGIWIMTYCDLISKEHRNFILSKGPLLFVDEFCWVLHDGFLIVHILAINQIFEPVGLVRSIYNFGMAGLIARVIFDFLNTIYSVCDIVDLEAKKES